MSLLNNKVDKIPLQDALDALDAKLEDAVIGTAEDVLETEFVASDATDWDGDASPADIQAALDQLGARATDAEDDKLTASQAANVAALTGSLTGTTTGVMSDVSDLALSTSDTYSDAAVNTAINAKILALNLQLKELQVKLNEEIAALKSANVQASS